MYSKYGESGWAIDGLLKDKLGDQYFNLVAPIRKGWVSKKNCQVTIDTMMAIILNTVNEAAFFFAISQESSIFDWGSYSSLTWSD